MKKAIILLFLALNGFTTYAQNGSKIPSDNKLNTRLDSLVDKLVSDFMSNPSRVGISVGIIKDGHSYFYNYGTTQLGTKQLPTANSVYELASITKTFSSALLAQAVLDKKVNLDDDIRLYLDGQYPNLAYKGTPIKLINLANLTSGLPNWMPDAKDIFNGANPDSIPFILDALHKKYKRADLYRDLHGVKLDTVPGAVTRHCNTAAQLLGYIMERVYGASLETILRKKITGPLKMKNTAFLAEGKLPINLVKGYDGKGRLMPFITWEDLQVAASLSSTTKDMVKYMNYQLDENKSDVKLSHQPTNGKQENGAIALNWKINITSGNRRMVSHTGGSLGFSTYMAFYPDLKTGIVLLSNEADSAVQGKLIELANNILK